MAPDRRYILDAASRDILRRIRAGAVEQRGGLDRLVSRRIIVLVIKIRAQLAADGASFVDFIGELE